MELKSLPKRERPRERLMRYGADALSTVELLALILGSGTKKRSVLLLAADLLSHFGSLKRLASAKISELQAVLGIGLAQAIRLQAIFSLMQRVEEPIITPFLDSPETIYREVYAELKMQEVEVLLVLLCDTRKRLIHREIISKGTLSQLLVHPREIFHLAIRHRAHSLILVHNHPSGDPTPSSQDIDMTKHLISVSQMVGIELLDHLIVGKDSYYSFSRKKISSNF